MTTSRHGATIPVVDFTSPKVGHQRPSASAAAFAAVVCVLLLNVLASLAQTTAPLNPPLGPFIGFPSESLTYLPTFSSDQRLVLTPYFYWYDVFSSEHITNPDGSDALTDHPFTFTGFSYRSRAWHRTQLLDMTDAGIDVVLPVYWGEPSARRPGQPVSEHPWSYAGLPPLVEARDQLLAEGRHPPRIGLFYDTSTLQWNAVGERIDLTTPRGRQWFYESIRDFFSLIPPRHWATLDGKPVVFLYSAAFATRHDSSCIDFTRTAFARDFGGATPFIVREVSWNVDSEQVYAWGGALGLKNPGVASLGPGYDHSAVPGRSPLIVDRRNGAFYEENWRRLLRRPSKLVLIETWNEFHEGTDIAHSRQFGRDYIALTRRFSDLFRSGFIPPPSSGPYSDARIIEVVLGTNDQAAGLTRVDSADGLTSAATLADRECRIAASNPFGSRYIYFRVDDAFKWAESMEVTLLIEYFDVGRGSLRIEYDGSDRSAPFQGAYSPSEMVALTGSQSWRTAALRLRAARFVNSQNSGADLRVSVGNLPVGVRRVQVLREGLKAVRFGPTEGCELQIFAIPGQSVDLESSDNLTRWKPLIRLRPSSSVSRHMDPAAASLQGHRWYRLRPSP